MNIDAPHTTEAVDVVEFADDEPQLEPAFDQIGGNRLKNLLEMDLPRPKALVSHHPYDVGQGAIAGTFCRILKIEKLQKFARRCVQSSHHIQNFLKHFNHLFRNYSS